MEGYRLLDSPLLDLPGVRRLATTESLSTAFGDVRALQALLKQATERASAVLSPRHVEVLQMYMAGCPVKHITRELGLQSRQHVSEAYRRPAVEAVTREFLYLAGVEIGPK